MSLSDQQWLFLQDIALLILYAGKKGYKLTGGQLHRPDELQEYYYSVGKSQTLVNRHGQRLAIDFNIFYNGEYLNKSSDRLKCKRLGDFWEDLNPLNRWGGSWRGKIESGESTFVDIPHFERRTR
jgi:hypothetical protein